MKEFIGFVKQNVSEKVVIYICIGLILIVIFSIILFLLRKKSARSLLEEYDMKYNILKGVPLSFKLNKAVALSRVNEAMSLKVDEVKEMFDVTQEKLKEISVLLAEADDLIFVRKFKKAVRLINDMEDINTECEGMVNAINDKLDIILEQENEQREHINKLKEEFRVVKIMITNDESSFTQNNDYVENEIANIERMFSSFEEWMFASEFNKAASQQDEILSSIKNLQQLAHELPNLYEMAKITLPKVIDEVGFLYAQARNKGVLLDHLEISKHLEVITSVLGANLNKLDNGAFQNVQDELMDCQVRVAQLVEQIRTEEEAFDEVNANIGTVNDDVREINKKFEEIESLYTKVYERFGFENWNERLKEGNISLEQINVEKRSLDKILLDKEEPYSVILIAYHKLAQSLHIFKQEVMEMKEKLDNACSDEERAKKQFVKLELIMNQIRVKMREHRLPSVSEQYEKDLLEGENILISIHEILAITPLDIARLNQELKEGIDTIYTLYNNVNKLVGMAIMVENAIVFGNRYRSSYPEVDSELTRAELCFRNGQFTKSLQIALLCIKKIHPSAYEKLFAGSDALKIQNPAV